MLSILDIIEDTTVDGPGFVIYHTNYSLIIDSDISGIEEVKE